MQPSRCYLVSVEFSVCTNILTDLIRGTKGDNGSAKDLGGAKKVKNADGKEVLEVELPTAKEDVDSLWAASRNALRQKPPPEKEHRGTFIVLLNPVR